MKEIIIGTAGHIDHGKTSLVFALTGTNPDRLSEEKRRGITTDLGFAHLALTQEISAGILDVPGHEKFIHNMLAGAGQIDLVLMTVAANEGVMPQTKEHLEILSLLQIPYGVVALTKCDLVSQSMLAQRRAEIKLQFAGSFLEAAPLVQVSSKTGEGLPQLRAALAQTAQRVAPRAEADGFFLPIDRVFTLPGFGTVVTGVVMSGRVSVGDAVEIGPAGGRARVRGIQCYGEERLQAQPGMRAALNLSRVKKEELSRGAVLGTPGTLHAGTLLNVQLSVLPGAKRMLQNNSRLHLAIGSASLLCRVVLFTHVLCVAAGESAVAQLRLEAPVVARPGERFVLRFYSPVETLGGGVVLEIPHIRQKHGDKRAAAALRILAQGTPEQKLRLAFWKNPFLTHASFLLRTLPPKTFEETLSQLLQNGVLKALPGDCFVSAAFLKKHALFLSNALATYHRENPLENGMPFSRLQELAQGCCAHAALPGAALLVALQEAGVFVKKENCAALPGFFLQPTPQQGQVVSTVQALFSAQGYGALSAEQAAKKLGLSLLSCRRAAEYLCGRGVLFEVLPQTYMAESAYRHARNVLEQVLQQEGRITLAHYRDLLQTSRKPAQALLEQFDRMGLTILTEDFRVKGAKIGW